MSGDRQAVVILTSREAFGAEIAEARELDRPVCPRTPSRETEPVQGRFQIGARTAEGGIDLDQSFTEKEILRDLSLQFGIPERRIAKELRWRATRTSGKQRYFFVLRPNGGSADNETVINRLLTDFSELKAYKLSTPVDDEDEIYRPLGDLLSRYDRHRR